MSDSRRQRPRQAVHKPKQVANPPNPYATSSVELLGPAPDAKLEVYDDESKSILSENNSPDVPFRFSLNPYRGCMHGCAYCYARPSHHYLDFGAGSDFDRKIVVKRNAPDLLRRRLQRKSWTYEPIAISGNTDCYMPLEANLRLTRACLDVLADFASPFGIITKSALVRRDIDVLKRAASVTNVTVNVSIPFARREDALRVEPWASPPQQRFDALKALNDAGISTAVAIAPLILGLNDEQIPEILERAKDAGADVAWFIHLRLPGVVRDVFEERMQAAYPDRHRKILNAVDEERRLQGKNAHAFGHRMTGASPRFLAARQLFYAHAKRLGFDLKRMQEKTGSMPTPAKPAVPQTKPPPPPPKKRQLTLFDE